MKVNSKVVKYLNKYNSLVKTAKIEEEDRKSKMLKRHKLKNQRNRNSNRTLFREKERDNQE